MRRIIAESSVCLDGLVTGPDPSPSIGPGAGGGALYTWAPLFAVGAPCTPVPRGVVPASIATCPSYDLFR
jgi:hypothetical protein